MTIQAAAHLRRFGLEPKVALLSHSSFGSRDTAERRQDVREALEGLAGPPSRNWRSRARCTPMPRSSRRSAERIFPNSRLTSQANLLIMPNLDAANIAFNLVKALGEGLPVGPILIGTDGAGAHPDFHGDRPRRGQHVGDRGRGCAGPRRRKDAASRLRAGKP